MGFSIETFAALKKYIDKVIGSGSGGTGIPDGSINAEKLTPELRQQIESSNEHISNSSLDEAGVHNVRYYNGVLQYFDGNQWQAISIASLSI